MNQPASIPQQGARERQQAPAFEVRGVEAACFDARLGAGNFSMSVKKIPHQVHTGKDIKTGKPYESHKWGRTIVTLNFMASAEFRKEGGQADQEAKKFMDALSKKK